VLGIATLGGGGLFATFSYITPMMTKQAGFADSSMTWLLMLFGAGMTAGKPPPPRQILLPPRLIVRASSRRYPSKA